MQELKNVVVVRWLQIQVVKHQVSSGGLKMYGTQNFVCGGCLTIPNFLIVRTNSVQVMLDPVMWERRCCIVIINSEN